MLWCICFVGLGVLQVSSRYGARGGWCGELRWLFGRGRLLGCEVFVLRDRVCSYGARVRGCSRGSR